MALTQLRGMDLSETSDVEAAEAAPVVDAKALELEDEVDHQLKALRTSVCFSLSLSPPPLSLTHTHGSRCAVESGKGAGCRAV